MSVRTKNVTRMRWDGWRANVFSLYMTRSPPVELKRVFKTWKMDLKVYLHVRFHPAFFQSIMRVLPSQNEVPHFYISVSNSKKSITILIKVILNDDLQKSKNKPIKARLVTARVHWNCHHWANYNPIGIGIILGQEKWNFVAFLITPKGAKKTRKLKLR